MNTPEVRAAAVHILMRLRPFTSDEALDLIRLAQVWGDDGVELELAALYILKPDAPRGEEIEW